MEKVAENGNCQEHMTSTVRPFVDNIFTFQRISSVKNPEMLQS